jgi:hypothetical protein
MSDDALFELPEDKRRREEQEKKAREAKEAREAAEKKAKASKPKPKEYAAGTDVYYDGFDGDRRRALPEAMTEAQVYAWLNDDYPEITTDLAELRFDEKKNRLFFVRKMHKKGVAPRPAVGGYAR